MIFIKKKILIGFILLFVIGIGIILFGEKKENIKGAKIIIGESLIYSKEEINEAIDVVLEEFKNYPASLRRLEYNEEKSIVSSKEWARQYGVDEAIVLYSDFKTYTGSKPYKSGLDSNKEYQNWSWVLVRTNKENWKLKTNGYG